MMGLSHTMVASLVPISSCNAVHDPVHAMMLCRLHHLLLTLTHLSVGA